MPRIALIGPESVGKSTLAHKLGLYYNLFVVDEYARTYVEQLSRPYTYHDVEKIAYQQCQEFANNANAFFDTDMIITKVWFDVVYGCEPEWLKIWMLTHKMDFYLLLKPDIEWKADSTRENGDRREWLYGLYKKEIEQLGVDYVEIGGKGDERLLNAIESLKPIICNQKL